MQNICTLGKLTVSFLTTDNRMGLINVQLVDVIWFLILFTGEDSIPLTTGKRMGRINIQLVDAKWHIILYTGEVNVSPHNWYENGTNKYSIGRCKMTSNFVHQES